MQRKQIVANFSKATVHAISNRPVVLKALTEAINESWSAGYKSGEANTVSKDKCPCFESIYHQDNKRDYLGPKCPCPCHKSVFKHGCDECCEKGEIELPTDIYPSHDMRVWMQEITAAVNKLKKEL